VRRVAYSYCQSNPTPDQSDETCRDELRTLQFEEPQESDTTKGVQSMSRIWQTPPSPVKSCSRTLARPEIPLAENPVSQDLALYFEPNLLSDCTMEVGFNLAVPPDL